MGFLPIAVAIFGFVLLWAVVNYNSLLTRRDQIRKMEEESKELEKRRHAILAALEKLLSQLSIIDPELSLQLQQIPTARSVKTKQLSTDVKLRLQQTVGLQNHAEVDTLLNRLEDTDFHLYYAQRKLQQSILVYNKLVNRMPSRIVATLSGFKSVSENR
ncbi:LemA family protein [Rhodocytophaga rosea]|uniref:LemA family protein n=1 Tax=Rhodocytophaga rosea TaxID=2704465 RepID=A0A6C0GQC4_9BACT|nr:LemA family protein [Rhodocytophaga rosea]QHT70275.1 LemA family protein [Rhodocytophaga rosea]